MKFQPLARDRRKCFSGSGRLPSDLAACACLTYIRAAGKRPVSELARTLESAMNSLELPGRPEDTRVVVAMSGGVNSSVVAAHPQA